MPRVGDALEVEAVRCQHVHQRVAPELLAGSPGKLPGDRAFGHDGERLDRLHVAPLHERLRRLAGGEIEATRALPSPLSI